MCMLTLTLLVFVPSSHLWCCGGEGRLRARFSVHPREVPSGSRPARPACFEGLYGHPERRPEQWSHTGTVWCEEKHTLDTFHGWMHKNLELEVLTRCYWPKVFILLRIFSYISFFLHIPITSCLLSSQFNSFLFKLCTVLLVKMNVKNKHINAGHWMHLKTLGSVFVKYFRLFKCTKWAK